MYIWLLLLGAFLVLNPWIPNPGFGPFKTTEKAESFLHDLWQVEAAALALSLAIIVFAVQAYRSATQERYGGTLRRYIRASWLQEGYEMGVVALLLTAAVLLGVGHGGPAGSAGAVAAGASVVSLFVLPLLLTSALRTTHRDFLREERERRLKAAVRDQVDHEVQARISLTLLNRLVAAEPLELRSYGRARQNDPVRSIGAEKAGVVADINLRRLIRLARRARASGELTLGTHLYDYVGTETAVLLVPAGTHEPNERLARRIVSVKEGRRRDETLNRYLDDLEEEAVAAIRSGGPAAFQAIADAYIETLMAFPRSWERYGQRYTTAIARGTDFFPMGPVDEISKQFCANIVEALRASSDEVLRAAAYLPINACTRALPYAADGLIRTMLGLSPSFLGAAWAHGGEKGRVLERCVTDFLVEFTWMYLQPGLEVDAVEERLRFGSYVEYVYTQIGTMLKFGVDEGRVDYLRSLDGDWGTLLEHWDVELLEPHPSQIPALEQAAEGGEDGAAERLAEARNNATLMELQTRLNDQRTILRFGLALWAWRQKPQSWRESFNHFSSRIGALPEIVAVTSKAINAEHHDRVPWSNWILSTLQTRQAHFIPTVEVVIDTFVAMALRAINPEEATPTLEPAEWMQSYIDYTRKVLAAAVTDPRNSDLADVADRADKLREVVEAGAQTWSEQERLTLIEAPLVPEKVEAFSARVLDALGKQRVLPDLLRMGDALIQLNARPSDASPLTSRAPKAFFVADERVVGADMWAKDAGRNLARWELERLTKPMENVGRSQLVVDDPAVGDISEFVERLQTLISRVSDKAGSNFVALLLPLQWPLSQALGIPFLGRSATPPQEWGFSDSSAYVFAGVFAGVPVLRLPEVPEDAIYVVDFLRYVKAEKWEPDEQEAVGTTVPTEDEAREFAQRDPALNEIGEEEIVRRWRETALIRIDPGLRLLSERDDSAVTAVNIPSSLRRD